MPFSIYECFSTFIIIVPLKWHNIVLSTWSRSSRFGYFMFYVFLFFYCYWCCILFKDWNTARYLSWGTIHTCKSPLWTRLMIKLKFCLFSNQKNQMQVAQINIEKISLWVINKVLFDPIQWKVSFLLLLFSFLLWLWLSLILSRRVVVNASGTQTQLVKRRIYLK